MEVSMPTTRGWISLMLYSDRASSRRSLRAVVRRMGCVSGYLLLRYEQRPHCVLGWGDPDRQRPCCAVRQATGLPCDVRRLGRYGVLGLGIAQLWLIRCITSHLWCVHGAHGGSDPSLHFGSVVSVTSYIFSPSSDYLTPSRFVHERGTRTALYNLAFLAGVSVGPLIAGHLIQHYSWRVCSYAMAAALVIQLILTFFFMPETAYHRPAALNIDQGLAMVSWSRI